MLTNSQINLKLLMKKKCDSTNFENKTTVLTNKSFTSTGSKKLTVDTTFQSKRQSSQELLMARLSSPKCKFDNSSQRSVSPNHIVPDSLKKIYKQIQNKINNQNRIKQKTEEGKQKIVVDGDIQQIINQEECVFSILAIITTKKKVIKLCQKYMNLIPHRIPEQLTIQNQKIQHRSILLERVGILVTVLWALSDDEDYQHIKNLLLYIHQGMLINLELYAKLPLNERSQQHLLTRISRAKTNRKSHINFDINQLKKNSNVVHSLLILIIENSFELKFNKLTDLITDSMTLQKGTIAIQAQFSKVIRFQETIDTEQTDEFCYEILPRTERYTLIIDLDETLVHYQELVDDGQFLVRPYAEEFLIEMSRFYEIIIFTAALQDYADFILDLIDSKKVISHRLYRQHTTVDEDETYIKDISKINRSLKTTIIIDNMAENFKYQPDNGICIQSWYGEPGDRALLQLAPLLKQIVIKNYGDVRMALRRFRDQMIENMEKGSTQPHLNLTLD